MTDIYMTEAGEDEKYGPAYLDENGALTERGEWTIQHALGLLAEAAHRNARSKGWYDADRKLPEELALVHSEVSEVLEEYRDGRGSDEHYYSFSTNDNPGMTAPARDFSENFFPRTLTGKLVGKPEGIPAESADILIRVADYCGNPDRPVDLGRAVVEKLRYNRTRPYKHGKRA